MAEKKPTTWTYTDGEVRLADLPITAGLLGLNGAALDAVGNWYYPGETPEEKRAWNEFVRRPGVRIVRTELTGSHVERIPKRLLTPWVDKTNEGQGRHYKAGEYAPMPQVVFHVRAHYESVGVAVARRRWTEDDVADWMRRWHKPGNHFLTIPAVVNDWTNKLRNLMRDEHGVGQRRPMAEVR